MHQQLSLPFPPAQTQVPRRRRRDQEKARAHQAAYVARHHEAVLARRRAAYAAQSEEARQAALAKEREVYAARAATVLARQRLSRQRHPETVLAYAARRRVRLHAVPSEQIDYAAILARDGRVCHICGGDIGPDERLEFDHVIPIARDGPHLMSNIRVAHAACNRRKGAKLLPDFAG